MVMCVEGTKRESFKMTPRFSFVCLSEDAFTQRM